MATALYCQCIWDDDPCGADCPECGLPPYDPFADVDDESVFAPDLSYCICTKAHPPISCSTLHAALPFDKEECIAAIKNNLYAVEKAVGTEKKVEAAKVLFTDLLYRISFIKAFPNFEEAVRKKIGQFNVDPKARTLWPTLDVLSGLL
jgi:hypothetical protein